MASAPRISSTLSAKSWDPSKLSSNITQAKPRRKTDPKKGNKFVPAPIPSYNRTPTPEPPRYPKIIFEPGLHLPLNHGRIEVLEAPTKFETIRDGGDYPTRPGSKKRIRSLSDDLSREERPTLLKRLKSAHNPCGYHARTNLEHSAAAALHRAMDTTPDFTEKNKTVADILVKAAIGELACIAASPVNGAAIMEMSKKDDPKGKGKEPPLGLNGEWNDWVMLLNLRRAIEEKLAANPVVPCAADRENIWSHCESAQDAVTPQTTSQIVDPDTDHNCEIKVAEDSAEESTDATEIPSPKRTRPMRSLGEPMKMANEEPSRKRSLEDEDVSDVPSMGPPPKRSRKSTSPTKQSATPTESDVVTPPDEEFVLPWLKPENRDWDIPLLPEPAAEGPRIRDEDKTEKSESPKRTVIKLNVTRSPTFKPLTPKAQSPNENSTKAKVSKAQIPKAESPKSNVSKTQAPKSQAAKTHTLKFLTPKLEDPESQAGKTQAQKTEVVKTEAPNTQILKPLAPKPEAPKAHASKSKAKAPKSKATTTKTAKSKASKSPGPDPPAPSPQVPSSQVANPQAPTSQAPATEAPVPPVPDTQAPAPQATESHIPESTGTRKSTRKRTQKRLF